MSEPTYEYIPGTCNLGMVETKRRTRNGYIGLAATVVVTIILEYLDVRRGYRIFVLPPLFYAISGFLQARFRFCYLYGLLGVFSIKGKKQLEKSPDNESLKKDKQTAWKIIIMTLLGSGLLTAVYMVM